MPLEVIIAKMKGLSRQIRHLLGVIHKRGRLQAERRVRVVARDCYVCAESVIRNATFSIVLMIYNPQLLRGVEDRVNEIRGDVGKEYEYSECQ